MILGVRTRSYHIHSSFVPLPDGNCFSCSRYAGEGNLFVFTCTHLTLPSLTATRSQRLKRSLLANLLGCALCTSHPLCSSLSTVRLSFLFPFALALDDIRLRLRL